MRCRSEGILAAVLTALIVAGPALPALAAETSSSQLVIVRAGTVFPDDLYAGALRVIIDGTLEGDLVAFAAEEVVVNGTVTGSLIAVAPNVTINGSVEETVRMSGNRLTVTGEVGGDVVAAAAGIELTPTSRVEGDVLAWAWSGRALGTIGGDLSGTFRRLDLAGTIRGGVDVTVTGLEIVEELLVERDLGYRSDAVAVGLERARVDGVVVNKSPLPPNIRVRALGVLGRFLTMIMLSVAALSIAYGWPRRTCAAITEVRKRPVRRWLTGAVVLFSPLLALGASALLLNLAPAAAAFPLLAVLLPLFLGLVGLVFALSLIAGAPAAGWLGGALFKKLDLYGAILAGSIIAGVVWYLPLVGWLVPLILLPLGLGAWIKVWTGQTSASGSDSSEPISSSS
jgi:cytoskeletal protein CcmA (bactofilin family)